MKLTSYLVSLPLVLSLVSCVTPTASPDRSSANAAVPATMASFPRITSSGWRCTQAAPTASLQGFPSVLYRNIANPDNSIEILLQGEKPHRINTTEPEFVTIMGQKVQTYGSGNEVVAFATQPFLLTPPGGSAAYYSFEFTGDNIYKSRKIPEFSW